MFTFFHQFILIFSYLIPSINTTILSRLELTPLSIQLDIFIFVCLFCLPLLPLPSLLKFCLKIDLLLLLCCMTYMTFDVGLYNLYVDLFTNLWIWIYILPFFPFCFTVTRFVGLVFRFYFVFWFSLFLLLLYITSFLVVLSFYYVISLSFFSFSTRNSVSTLIILTIWRLLWLIISFVFKGRNPYFFSLY